MINQELLDLNKINWKSLCAAYVRMCSTIRSSLNAVDSRIADNVLSDLDNCKWSRPDFWRFAIKKFAIIKKFFYSIIILLKILLKFSCQSSSDEFYFNKTYLTNKNIIKLNFNLTSPYYILKLSPSKTLKQKK